MNTRSSSSNPVTNVTTTTIGDIGFTGAQGIQFAQTLGQTAVANNQIFADLIRGGFTPLEGNLTGGASNVSSESDGISKPVLYGLVAVTLLMVMK